MLPRFEYGAVVRVLRNIRNDGTFPGLPTGAPLVRRGSVGHVRDVGIFLQDQLVYSVHFTDVDRIIGCREEELQPASDPWTASRFETRDRVTPRRALGVGGQVAAKPGDLGEVVDVIRNGPEGVVYHVRFSSRIFAVPENAIDSFEIGEALALAWYRDHPEHFAVPETRLARHILITVNPDFPENTREQALFRIRELAGRLAGEPEAFPDLAARYSECPSALESGLLGGVPRGVLYPELETMLFSLKEGEVGGPVESGIGFHLLWCEKVIPAHLMPFEKVAARIMAALSQNRQKDDKALSA